MGLFIRFVPRQPWVTRTMGHQVLVREYQKNLRGPIIFLVTSLWRPHFMAWLDKESLEIDLTKISEPFSYKLTPDDNLIPSCPLLDWYIICASYYMNHTLGIKQFFWDNFLCDLFFLWFLFETFFSFLAMQQPVSIEMSETVLIVPFESSVIFTT